MRIVYAANAKRSEKPSLNDCLETGPNLLPKIFDILVRFRAYKYAITSDIKAAFLNIGITGKDRDYLQFLWVDDISQEDPCVIVFRFIVVVFGLNCLPNLLSATIITHMTHYSDINRDFVETFLRDLYMDDNTSGTQNIDAALDYYIFARTLMLQGGFELRKWQSNSAELMKNIHDYEKFFTNEPVVECKGITKILGIQWDKELDLFIFDLKDVINEAIKIEVVTKRGVLKVVASIYDPLGILSSFVINLKLLFQEVCALKCDWDITLPEEFCRKWKKALSSLKDMDLITLPRFYLNCFELKHFTKFELHGFGDASLKAYAAVVYIRATKSDKQILVNIIASKTKVVPLNRKTVTIPKLELMACLVLSHLLKSVRDLLSEVFKIDEIKCWTESMDCYYWIKNSTKVWQKFVQLRVTKIRENLPAANDLIVVKKKTLPIYLREALNWGRQI